MSIPDLIPDDETPEERDDRLRQPGYTEGCSRWESLTAEDIYPDGWPPFPALPVFTSSEDAYAYEDLNPEPEPAEDPWAAA